MNVTHHEFVGGPLDGEVADMIDALRTIYIPRDIASRTADGPLLLPKPHKDPRLVGIYQRDGAGNFVWQGEDWR